MNRKMFKKSRPARDALNQAGGIMDSSPELMQTVQNYPVPGVQNFANGSNVRIPGRSDSPAANARRLRELQDERDLGVYNRNFLNKAAGIFGAPFKAFGAFSDDAIAGILSTLGMENSAVNRRKIADAGYERAGEMIQGSGVVTEGPIFDDSSISAFDVENTGLSMTPTSSLSLTGEDALAQKAAQNQAVKLIEQQQNNNVSSFDASLPFGGMLSSEELAKRQARFDAEDAERNIDNSTFLDSPDELAVTEPKISDQVSVQNREAALYGSASGFNDYLAKLKEETDAEKFERLRRTAAPATKEALAAEETRLKKIKDDETAMGNREKAFGDTGAPISSADDIKKQVQSTVISGSPQEKQKDLKQLMAEFTDNAPKYEGMNKGLAIAKIGFAIAAGDSPNAMTNIARGLSQGADEFIKDKANRDAFDRQLKLTALQYGLGEQSKIDTQRRADDRNIFDFVATEDGSFKGEEFKKGQNIRVSMTDIMANGGKLPAELQNQELYLSGVEAVNKRNKLVIEAADNLRKEKIIEDSAAQKYKGDYTTASSNFKSAERGVNYLETALIGTAEDEVTGGTAALKDLLRKGGSLFGIEVGKEYKTLDEAKTAMSIALQPLIKVTLGETQSANSISNRDVEFLIKAVYGDDALSKNSFSLATADSGQMIIRLKGAIKAMRAAQAKDLNTMKTIEDQLVSRILPGQGEGSGMTLIRASQRDVEPFLPGGERTAKGSGLVPAEEPNTFNIVYN